MNELLQKLMDTSHLFQSFIQQDISIAISDTEKYVYVLDSETIKFPFKVGTRIDDIGYRDSIETINKTKKPVINYVTREMSGNYPMKCILSPVFDKNEIVGYFSVTINMDKNDKIERASEKLKELLGQANLSIHGISDEAKQLNSMVSSIEDNTMEAEENVKLGNDAIALITGIAKQSNLLGLNAAIEASKAGENGKGFSVVASEMRTLAVQSKETAEQVVSFLKKIEKSVNNVLNDIRQVKDISETQYKDTTGVCENIDNISSMYTELVKYSKE